MRTLSKYIPGDICPHNVGKMSAQCRHKVRTMSAQCPHYVRISFVRHILFVRCCADIVPTLCGHISPGVYICRHYILLRFSALIFSRSKCPHSLIKITQFLVGDLRVRYNQNARTLKTIFRC